MYFPYLRGKQFELLAVRDSDFLLEGRILPVVDPISVSKRNQNQVLSIADKGIRFSLIMNGENVQGHDEPREIVKLFAYLDSKYPGRVLPAFEIRAGHTLPSLAKFSRAFRAHQCVVVHRNHNFSAVAIQRALRPLSQPSVQIILDGGVPHDLVGSLRAVGTVLLKDGFNRCRLNELYPARSNFGDLLYQYEHLGFDGFGDFSIIGDWYASGGGAPKTVALHLTERERSSLIANHFVSTTPPTKGDTADKYFDALEKLVRYTRSPIRSSLDTKGVDGYLASYETHHFPQLGKPKQWSIMHHMEIVDRELAAQGVSSFL